MSMFIDRYSATDLYAIVHTCTADGHGEFDGMYVINYILAFRKQVLERSVFYPTLEERDASFARMLAMLQAHEDACVIQEEGQDDDAVED